MKRHKHTGKYELKTVQWIPTHAQHERSEGKRYERMEESAKRRLGNTSFVDGVGKSSFVDNVGKNTRYMVDGKKVKGNGNGMPRPSMNYVPRPEPMTREQFEEEGKQLEKTDRVTGLWYPHKSK